MKKKIVIEMQGGLIEKIYINFNDQNIEALLVDHDQDGSDESKLSLVPGINKLVCLQSLPIGKAPLWVEDVFLVFNEGGE